MRTLLCLLALALPLQAATIQIIVRADNGTEKENVTIPVDPANGTGNQALLSIQDWRDGQVDGLTPKFPDTQAGREAFWRAVLMPPLKDMIKRFPYSGLATKKAAKTTAGTDEDSELDSVFQ